MNFTRKNSGKVLNSHGRIAIPDAAQAQITCRRKEYFFSFILRFYTKLIPDREGKKPLLLQRYNISR